MAKKILGEEGAQVLVNAIKNAAAPTIIQYSNLDGNEIMVNFDEIRRAINENCPMYVKINPQSSLIPISYNWAENGETVQHEVYFPWGVLLCDAMQIHTDPNGFEWLKGVVHSFKIYED